MIFITVDTHATSESIVYVFGIGDLLGRKVGQVTDACAVEMANCLIAATSSEKSAAVPCGRYAHDGASAITKRDPGQ